MAKNKNKKSKKRKIKDSSNSTDTDSNEVPRVAQSKITRMSIEIQNDSPVVLSAGPPVSNVINTLDFIPGSALRGILAWQYLRKKGLSNASTSEREKDYGFKKLFLEQLVRFGPGYVNGARKMPLTARSCKYHPGYTANNGHGVVDLTASLIEQQWPDIGGNADGDTCKVCGKTLDYITGYVDGVSEQARLINPSQRLEMHTAMDNQRGAAATGQLFGERVLTENQKFRATVEVPVQNKRNFNELFDDGGVFTATMGKGASRGLGWITCRQISNPPAPSTLSRRINAYKEYFSHPILVVTLHSDVLFSDEFFRDRSHIYVTDLEHMGVRAQDWEVEPITVAEHRAVFGWDGYPVLLPKMHRTALAAGSVFVFKSTQKSWTDIQLPSNSGIGWLGDRNEDGYGRVALLDTFHLDPNTGD